MRATTPEMYHPTTPTSQYYEDNEDKMTTTTTVMSHICRKIKSRKQIHVYIPQITC